MNLFPLAAVELPPNILSSLGSRQFHEREVAQGELLDWARAEPSPVMDDLLKHSLVEGDPEVRERCLNVLRALVTDKYLSEGEGYIGIGLQDEISVIPGEANPRGGIRVLQVQAGTPAQRAGIQQHDLIIAIDGQVWQEVQFRANIRMMKPNTEVDLKILRDGGLVDLKVTLGRRPPESQFFNGQIFDPDAVERAAKEAYFRRWLSLRKLPK